MYTYQIEPTNEYTRQIKVEISREVTDKKLNEVLRETRAEVDIPGFRRGKVPFSVLKKMMKNPIKDLVMDSLYNEYIQKIIDKENIQPVGKPDIESKEYDFGQPYTFTVNFEVVHCEDIDYKNLDIDIPKIRVTKKDIEKEIDQIRKEYAEIRAAEKDTVEYEDYATLNIEAFIEETPLEDYQREYAQIKIGNNDYIDYDAFDEELIGMQIGEEREFELDIPRTSIDPVLAGETVRFKVKILEIKNLHIPEFDDEFAKLYLEVDSVEEAREKVKKSLFENRESERKKELKEKIMEHLIEKAVVAIPPDYLKRYAASYREEINPNKNVTITDEEYREKREAWARKEITKEAILEKVVENEQIEIDDAEFEEEAQTYLELMKRFNPGKRTLTDNELLLFHHRLQVRKAEDMLYHILVPENEETSKQEEESSEPQKEDVATAQNGDQQASSSAEQSSESNGEGTDSEASDSEQAEESTETDEQLG